MKNRIVLAVALVMAPLLYALSLGPAEIEKANWESRQLTAYDINGDKLMDLAYIDGIERSIDLLMQKKAPSLETSKSSDIAPPLKMTRFTRERIPTEASPSAFVFGDFGGKGKTEVAYTSKRLGIVFMERNADGRWVQTHRIADVEPLPFTHVLWAGPLAKGQPVSLVALVKGKLLIIRDYKIVASYGMLYEDSGFVFLNDINGSGRMDIIYDYDGPKGFAYRLQDANGRFDREVLLNYAQETEKNFGYRGDSIFFFGGGTSFVEERKITPTFLKPSAQIYSCYQDSAVGSPVRVEGADGFVVADTKGAELILYRREGDLWCDPVRFPSLKAVSAMYKIDEGESSSLVLFSPDEHAIGIASWDEKNKRISFPRVLDLPDEPEYLLGTGNKVWAVTRNEKEFHLQQIFANGSLGVPMRLEGLSRPPDGGMALKENDATLMILFSSREGASFYFCDEKGPVNKVSVPASLVRSNFSGLELDKMGKGVLSPEGSEDLFISSRSTLRIFRFANKHLELADQVLPLNEDVNLHFPFVHEGVLWAYDSKSNNFLKFEKNQDHLWHNTTQVEAPPIEPKTVLSGGDHLIVLGRRAFYTLNPDAKGVNLVTAKRWESGLKVDGYNWGSLEYLEGEGKNPDVILFSQAKKIMEIVGWGDQPKSLLNFRLYEQDVHYSGRTGEEIEPREIIAADLTSRGKKDIIMLVHNKILIYPQK
jgi:hypothetical protein